MTKKDSDTIAFQMRIKRSWFDPIDDWRRKQTPIPSRSAAIRALVALGIEVQGKGKKR